MTVYGYARVSTDGQFGARSDRKQLIRLMGVLAKGTCWLSPGWIDWRGPLAIFLIC